MDVVVLRRDPAAVLKSRVELGHFCGRRNQNDWLLLPARGGGEPASEEDDMDGFEALMAYAAHTDTNIRCVDNPALSN